MGAFPGWAETRPLVSPFPSMTNVGFTAILHPFGTEPIAGYELRRYDPELNRVYGGGAFDPGYGWRTRFDLQPESAFEKVVEYLTPAQAIESELERVERYVLAGREELTLALVSSTDPLTHFKGDHEIVRALLEISDRVESLRRRHLELRGRPLQVVMFSDHGNTEKKVRRPGGIRRVLRGAGLRPTSRLEGPDDVVLVTYGVVGYGALYLDPSRARTAARAMLDHRGVDLAAWRTGAAEMRVASDAGEAAILWRGDPRTRELAYVPLGGDPLDLVDTMRSMRAAGLVDGEGYASREDWFEWTALGRYPDPLARLVDSLDQVWVRNAATVIFSFEPGYAWGVKVAEVGAWMRAGKLEATHGSLDRDSTLGFFLTSDAASELPRAVRAEVALAPWADTARCTTAGLVGLDPNDLSSGFGDFSGDER